MLGGQGAYFAASFIEMRVSSFVTESDQLQGEIPLGVEVLVVLSADEVTCADDDAGPRAILRLGIAGPGGPMGPRALTTSADSHRSKRKLILNNMVEDLQRATVRMKDKANADND